MQSFKQNRPFIENEFENARFDPSTGISHEELYAQLCKIQETPTDLPRQLVHAEAFAYILDNAQLEINPRTPFAVKLNVGVDYSYFASNDVFRKAFFLTQRTKVLEQAYPENLARMRDGVEAGLGAIYTDFWHTVPDWSYILKHGFAGILQNAIASRQKKPSVFLDAVITCYEAILRLLNRIYDYSLGFDIPEFSRCIKNLTHSAPKTLYEVMQLSVLYLYFEELGVERGRTLGPIDQLYLPYYNADLEKGSTQAELEDLFRYFFIHFTATKRYAEQPFTICGSSADGRDRTNKLSHLILEIYDEMNIYDPKIQIRCHKNLDSRILTKALSMIRKGHSSICLVNDEAVYAGYERIGIDRQDAQNYVLLGCYEPIIMGLEEGEIAPVRMNLVKFVEYAMTGGVDLQTGKRIGLPTKTDIQSFEEFFEIFLRQLDEYTEFALNFLEQQAAFNTQINPATVYSSSFEACIEKGLDIHEYPLKYNNLSLKHIGLATCVDALVAIKKYVFEQKECTLGQLRDILKANWAGHEDLRQKIIRDREKYGNNLPVPDEITVRITKHLEDRYCGRKLSRGGVLRLGLDSVYSCVKQGEKTPASADGRLAGTPISKNLCASDGMDRGGITAYMQSFLKMNSAAFVDATIFDFIMHPSAVEGDKGLQDFEALIKIFFNCGGFAAQGNIIDGKTLRDAQQNPEKYQTLQVRVCGWNEYFVKLSKVKQDMFIKQSEGA